MATPTFIIEPFFIVCGYVLRKLNAVPKNSASVFSSVLLNFFIPVLLLYIITQNLTPEIIINQRFQLISSTVIIIASCIGASFLSEVLDKKGSKRGIYTFAMAFPNFAFMGIPIVEAVYGSQSLSTVTLFIIPYYILVNVLGDIIIRNEKVPSLKTIFSPILIATVLGFVLVYTRVQLPDIIVKNARVIYSSSIPFAMLLIGFVLADKSLITMFTSLSTYFATFVRLILFPVITLIVLKLCGFSGAALGIPVLVSGMPTAVNGVMLAENAGRDSFLCSSVVFISTILGLITLPALAFIVSLF